MRLAHWLMLRLNREVHIELEWKLQDLWIGAFWKRTGGCIDLWICLLPCVPIHVSWWEIDEEPAYQKFLRRHKP